MNDKTIQLIRDFGSGIKSAVDQLAASLGVAAQKVLEVVIRQQIVVGIQDLIAFILILVFFFFVDRAMFKVWKRRNPHEGNDGIAFMGIILILGNVGCAVLAVFLLTDGIGHLINPGYYALHDIINMFNGGGTP